MDAIAIDPNAATLMPNDPTSLEALQKALHPALHRYCARMVGSVADGEDVVQDAMLNRSRSVCLVRYHSELPSSRAILLC